MARVTLRLPDELDGAVEDFVGYGSKSEFYRQAATGRLLQEGAIDDESEVQPPESDEGDREPADA